MVRSQPPVILRRGARDATWTLDTPSIPACPGEQQHLLRRNVWIVIAVVVSGLVLAFLGQISLGMYQVEGASMSPDLPDGSRVVVNKLAYRSSDGLPDWLAVGGDPQRGDLIVFHHPKRLGRDLVKRVIGLPGQTIVIERETGQVLVDGHELDERSAVGATLCRGKCRWTVPEESFFVLGDNRAVSDDSRLGWFVAAKDIIGKVLLEF